MPGTSRRTRRAVRAGWAALLPLLTWSGSACGDYCGDPDRSDCDEWLFVSWRPGELPDAPFTRLCVDGQCQDPFPAYTMDHNGESAASSWSRKPIPEGELEVRVELLDGEGRLVRAVAGVADPDPICGCDAVRLTVSDDGDSLVKRDRPWTPG